MTLKVDEKADARYLRLDDSKIIESEEVSPGVILDLVPHNFGKSLTARSFCYNESNSMGLNTQFSIATHIMAGLGYAPGAAVNSASIAGSVNTSPSFVRRTLAKLSKAGLVQTATGKHGACWLARLPREISLLEIYRAVDAPKAFAIHQYPVERRCAVSCHIKWALRRVLDETQKALEERLSRISLAQVISDLHRK